MDQEIHAVMKIIHLCTERLENPIGLGAILSHGV